LFDVKVNILADLKHVANICTYNDTHYLQDCMYRRKIASFIGFEVFTKQEPSFVSIAFTEP